jgi:thioredoxin 1
MIEITSADELAALLKTNDKVLVDFHATWCGPCRVLAPMLKGLEAQYNGVRFAKVDVDEVPALASKYNVTAMPTVIFLKDAVEVDRVLGANPSKVKAALEKLTTV